MKIIAIGDLHGSDIWEKILKEKADRYIFLGDYFDSKENISFIKQLENFNNLLARRQENPAITLLLGNHDFHYLYGIEERYTGFQPEPYYLFQEALEKALQNQYCQICTNYKNILFSHAGFSEIWVNNNHITFTNPDKFVISVNELFYYRRRVFGFTPGDNYDISGNEITQSPLWIRPESLVRCRLKNYIHIVGHTQNSAIIFNMPAQCVFIDALPNQYLRIIDYQFSAITL